MNAARPLKVDEYSLIKLWMASVKKFLNFFLEYIVFAG
jgi:hypothetical protein